MTEEPVVIILMGSASDQPHVDKITAALGEFGIPYVVRVASAHKTPSALLEILTQYEQDPHPRVYMTVAGRSNALSGVVDANVRAPVIACPPPSESFGGADIYSSLRMPSGVAPMVVLDPANAALAAAKILALTSPSIEDKILSHQQANRFKVENADAALQEQRVKS
jgi:5-(carboxyamino)imidazole ribonucleotide mutase/phosphoribosylaminoimidazole-succinocarboxamide synthase